MTGQQCWERYGRMKARKSAYESTLEECAKYVRPLRTGVSVPLGSREESGISVAQVYDSTALDANRKLGSRITGTLCNRGTQWFGIKVRNSDLNEVPNVRRWLDRSSEAMGMALGQSAFYAEANEALTDLPGVGTGGIFCDENPVIVKGFNGLTFRACGIGELAIDEGASGLVDVVGREFTLSAGAAARRWETGLSKDVMDSAQTSPEQVITFLHLVEPRDSAPKPTVNDDGTVDPLPPTQLPWASYYVESATQTLIETGGYYEMPYAIGRWSRPTSDLYGRGIGHDALPTVRTLNEAWRLWLEEWPYTINPPITRVMNRVVGPVRWVPGGITDVRDHEAIKEHPPQNHFDVVQAGIKMLQDFITTMFFTQEFSLRESSRMTTVEVYARLELMQQLMGPNVARIMHEILNRIIERVFGIMLRAKAFPPVPPELAAYVHAQGGWDVEYQSPLERAQRAPELQAIERTMQAGATLVTAKPDVIDVMDVDEAFRFYGLTAGVPARLIRTVEEVDAIRQARAQQTQSMASLQNVNTIADSLGKAAPMVKALQPANGGQGA